MPDDLKQIDPQDDGEDIDMEEKEPDEESPDPMGTGIKDPDADDDSEE